jgi:hypothetical protein
MLIIQPLLGLHFVFDENKTCQACNELSGWLAIWGFYCWRLAVLGPLWAYGEPGLGEKTSPRIMACTPQHVSTRGITKLQFNNHRRFCIRGVNVPLNHVTWSLGWMNEAV